MAVAPDAFLVEGVTDSLRDAAFDLAGGEDRVDDFADLLQGMEVGDSCCVGGGVDGDFGDVDSPGIGGIGLAAVCLVIPEDVGGRFVSDANLKIAELLAIADCGRS